MSQGKLIYNKGGKPPLLSDEGKVRLKKRLSDNTYRMTTKTFHNAVHEERIEDARRQGFLPESVYMPSRRALDRLEDELHIETKRAEYTTDARAKATAFLRNGVYFAAMSSWALDTLGVDPVKLFNIDGTSFTVGATGTEFASVKVVKVEKEDNTQQPTAQTFNQVIPKKGDGSYKCKWICV